MVFALAAIPQKQLLLGSYSSPPKWYRNLVVYDLAARAIRHTVPDAHAKWITTILPLHQTGIGGNIFVTSSKDLMIKVWDLLSGSVTLLYTITQDD